MIPNRRYWTLILLIVLVYVAGLFVTLFENDSAQFAVMAMRMVQENDFINLIKGTEEYLDKPHFHYWLSAFSYLIFGIEDWAYRIPAVLASLLGAYSCYGLGTQLYRKEVGRLAALIFLTAQTIILSNIDVRTDAVLTGFAAFALWQLVCYIEKEELEHLVFGSIGAGLAFSTKGQIAILVIGLPILCHLIYQKKWALLFNWRTLLALGVFFITISPVLYAYYQQFDLHPEKVIRGKSGRSGVFFILWEQSFERLSGEGVGKNSSDYFFFFHTYLWVFLPWTILGLAALGNRIKILAGKRDKRPSNTEVLTIGGILLIFVLISFAQFKLPHYLNITMPLFAVLTASYLLQLSQDKATKTWKALLGSQIFIMGIVLILALVLCLWVFKFESTTAYIALIAGMALVLFLSFRKDLVLNRIVTISAVSAIFINAVLNLHFYPSLLEYQAGSTMAEIVNSKGIPKDRIYKLNEMHTWGLDFYIRKPIKIGDMSFVREQPDIWLYLTDKELDRLQKQGFNWDQHYSVDQFRITRLQARFLNPESRGQVLRKMHLVHLVRN